MCSIFTTSTRVYTGRFLTIRPAKTVKKVAEWSGALRRLLWVPGFDPPTWLFFFTCSLTLLSIKWNFYFSKFKWVLPFSIAVFLLFSLVFKVKLMILAKKCNFRGTVPLRFASQNFHKKAPCETNKHYFSYFSLPKVWYYHGC